ncbi:MAG: hypothetical protein H6713_38340 [Myxococcales bacterium]|nr:hypothetical protein [Myxococcales bacterium]MCB9755827.1 hypothetical protein [Myxococcales bacterium]
MDPCPLAVTRARTPATSRALAGGRWLVVRPHPDGGSALHVLTDEPGDVDATALLSAALEALLLDVDDLVATHPEVTRARLPTWTLWRQDDNGNRFRMRRYRCRALAEREAEAYEARGHKQTYWVERA